MSRSSEAVLQEIIEIEKKRSKAESDKEFNELGNKLNELNEEYYLEQNREGKIDIILNYKNDVQKTIKQNNETINRYKGMLDEALKKSDEDIIKLNTKIGLMNPGATFMGKEAINIADTKQTLIFSKQEYVEYLKDQIKFYEKENEICQPQIDMYDEIIESYDACKSFEELEEKENEARKRCENSWKEEAETSLEKGDRIVKDFKEKEKIKQIKNRTKDEKQEEAQKVVDKIEKDQNELYEKHKNSEKIPTLKEQLEEKQTSRMTTFIHNPMQKRKNLTQSFGANNNSLNTSFAAKVGRTDITPEGMQERQEEVKSKPMEL